MTLQHSLIRSGQCRNFIEGCNTATQNLCLYEGIAVADQGLPSMMRGAEGRQHFGIRPENIMNPEQDLSALVRQHITKRKKRDFIMLNCFFLVGKVFTTTPESPNPCPRKILASPAKKIA